MTIKFACACGRELSVATRKAGKRGACPACGAVLTIPRPSSKAAPPPEPAPRRPTVAPRRASLADRRRRGEPKLAPTETVESSTSITVVATFNLLFGLSALIYGAWECVDTLREFQTMAHPPAVISMFMVLIAGLWALSAIAGGFMTLAATHAFRLDPPRVRANATRALMISIIWAFLALGLFVRLAIYGSGSGHFLGLLGIGGVLVLVALVASLAWPVTQYCLINFSQFKRPPKPRPQRRRKARAASAP